MNLHKMTTLLVLLTVVTLLTVACSQGDGDANTLTAPGDTSFRTSGNSGSHIPLALYEVTIDLVNETIETLPIRGADFHLNVLPFMEPPPLVYLNLNWDTLIINPVANIVEVDVVFSHPFGGKNEFMGFDVKGIVITDGSLGGFTDTGVVIPKSTEARLVNADGYTRWWNPTEFHHGGIFGYNDGLLGAPDSYVDYGSTVNGFKYFTDGLYPYSDVMNINTLLRGRFSAGAKNTRHYKIHFGSNPSDFLTFNYAVDASWAAPLKIPPSGMEDFPPEANQTEAFIVKVTELENTLYYTPPIEQGGGFVDLRIDVKDWQGLESIASVRVEAPQLFEGFILADPDPSNDPENIYGTYYASIEGEPTNNNGVQILVTVEDVNGSFEQGGMNEFNGPANTLLAAYQVHTAQVSSNAAPEVGPITSYDLDYLTPTCGTCYTYYASVSDYEDNIGDLIFNWIVTPPGSPPEDYYSIDTPGCDDSDVKTLDIRFNKTGTYVIDLMVEDTDGGYAYSEAPAEPNAGKGGAPPPVGNVVLIVNRDSPIQIIDTVTLDWDEVSGAGGYALYWADDPYAEPPVFTLLDTTYLSTYTIDPLNADNAYLFTVRSRTNIYNPETESGDSEYAFVEFETAEDDDPYPWTSYYRIYDQNDRFERVVGAGAQAGQMGWRMDVSNTYIQPYAWSVIASREIPDFANVEMCRLEFLREHPCPFDHHGLSVGTADDLIQSSSSDLCDSFDTSMVWQEGANYNEPVCAAIQGRFGEVAGNSGAFQDYCAYPTFSAFELPELLTDRHAAIAYGADNYQRTARVQLDDIAVIVY